MYIHILMFYPTNSFEINLKTTDFKRYSSGITRIYEYTPPPPINAIATALVFLSVWQMLSLTSERSLLLFMKGRNLRKAGYFPEHEKLL